jgi:hypothetical protein
VPKNGEGINHFLHNEKSVKSWQQRTHKQEGITTTEQQDFVTKITELWP